MIAQILGKPAREIEHLMEELGAKNVYSRTENGVIFSRRLVRQYEEMQRARNWGKNGGNPLLKSLTPPLTQPVNTPVKATDNPTINGGDKLNNTLTSNSLTSGEISNEQLDFVSAGKVLEHFNEKVSGFGAKFRENPLILREIALRLWSVENDVGGVCRMIDRQVELWRNDAKMRHYLRPSTLFAAEHFENYYGQREVSTVGVWVDEQKPAAPANDSVAAALFEKGKSFE